MEREEEEAYENEMIRVRVLVVDDSLVDRKIVERLIRRTDKSFEVVAVDSGKKALEILGVTEGKNLSVANGLQDLKVDIVLTDYCMPEMTGYDLLKALKEHSFLKSIPVVLMSSENDPQRIARCLAGGAEDFILKPLQVKHVHSLRSYAMPRTAPLQTTKPESKRKLPMEMLAENGSSERRPCLAGVAVA